VAHGGGGADAEGVGEDLGRGLAGELLPGGIAGGQDRDPGSAQDLEEVVAAQVVAWHAAGKQP
jgi:hypothetical protein